MNEIQEYTLLIAESLKGIRKDEVKILTGLNPLELAYKTIATLYPALVGHKPAVTTFCSVGQMVLLGHVDNNLPENIREEQRFKVGYHLVNVLFEYKKLKLTRGRFNRDPYTLEAMGQKTEERFITNKVTGEVSVRKIAVGDTWLDRAFYTIYTGPIDIPMHNKPLDEQPEPFDSFYHPVAGSLIRNINPKAIGHFTYDNTPMVYDAINKSIANPYRNNDAVLEVLLSCQDDLLFTLDDKDLTQEQYDSIKREQNTVLKISEGMKGKKFWQYEFYDSRGRKYSSLIYYSPQGGKMAKSLIKFDEAAPLGKEGYFWLMVHTSNTWGNDKIDKAPINDRFDYAEKHWKKIWSAMANDPVNYKEERVDEETGEITMVRPWTEADDPFGFLAAILEIKAAEDSGNKYTYESSILVAFDATCSGLQVLAAMSKDVESAEMCNLTQSDTISDYYQNMADICWEKTPYTDEEELVFNNIIDDLIRLNEAVDVAQSRAAMKIAVDNRFLYTSENKEAIWNSSKVFWGRMAMANKKRKIVKRPCMTYFYSCGAKTMSNSMYRDFHSEPEFYGLQKTFCFWLCSNIYHVCRTKMSAPTMIMETIIEMGKFDYARGYKYLMDEVPKSIPSMAKALALEFIREDEECLKIYNELSGKARLKYVRMHTPNKQQMTDTISSDIRFTINPMYIEGGLDYSIILPETNFLLMHNYRGNISKDIRVMYRNRWVKFKVCIGRGKKIDYKKVINATSANTVHGMDGELIKKATLDIGYPINTIHDSFGTIPANASALFEDVRVVFVEVFTKDIINDMLIQKGMTLRVELGDLDINEVYNNDFCFS